MSEVTSTLSTWVKLTQLTPGRVMLAADETAAKLEDDERAALAAPIAEAKGAGELQLEVEANWLQNKGIQPTRPDAPKIDAPADVCVGNIYDAAAKSAAMVPAPGDDPNDPDVQEEARIQAGAQALVQDHFAAEGARTITALPYEEQYARMVRLHAALTLPANGYLVTALGLGLYVRRLGRILPTYRRALARVGLRAVSFGEVVEARKASHEAVCKVVVAILNLPDPAARARLLAPIHYQQGLMAKARAEKRPTKDVDPETGRETDAPVLELPTESTPASGNPD